MKLPRPYHRHHARSRTIFVVGSVLFLALAVMIGVPASGMIVGHHTPNDPTKARQTLLPARSTKVAPSATGIDKAPTPAPNTAVTTTTIAPAPATPPAAAPSTAATPPATQSLDDYVGGIINQIPAQWRVPGWTYSIVDATPNGAMGDTWGPAGGAASYSQYSRSLMTPLMSTSGGQSAIEMVVLHEAMNAKAYSVVDANDWSTVAGWPATFASEVSLEPGYNDIDAAANCLELGALGFSLDQSSGFAESDIVGGCSQGLASWLTAQIAAAG